MFDLVADVGNYPKFVPLCDALHVHSREIRDGREIIVATMHVNFAVFNESYTSRIVADPEALTIDVEQLSGPFTTLTNRWRFAPAGEGTEISFVLAYAFKSRLMQAAAGAVLDKAFGRFAEAFEKRADAVYGVSAGSSSSAIS